MHLLLPPIALALGGLAPVEFGLPASGSPRPPAPADPIAGGSLVRALITALSRYQSSGLRALQLDAAHPGIRPRDLDASGRRDLSSTLRRAGLGCSGLDLFIPPDHFLKPDTVDRAVSSTLAAIDLAAALRDPARPHTTLALTLPASPPPDLLTAITGRADQQGLRLADFSTPPSADARPESLGVGIDPAALLLLGQDPALVVSTLGPRLAAARLSDAAAGLGAVRVAPGAGRLDVTSYLASLGVSGFAGCAVIDLRGVGAQAKGVARALDACAAALSPPLN